MEQRVIKQILFFKHAIMKITNILYISQPFLHAKCNKQFINENEPKITCVQNKTKMHFHKKIQILDNILKKNRVYLIFMFMMQHESKKPNPASIVIKTNCHQKSSVIYLTKILFKEINSSRTRLYNCTTYIYFFLFLSH